ncbi:MAG: hypothetical protein PHY73_08530 [Candidatus Omnitrophica bacterium]|nr:hypothetical protein [Candidatus Omnitrophota bacterium]
MKFIIFFIIICVLILVPISNSFSAVVELKAGNAVTGTILSQTGKSVKVLLNSGNKATYYVDEIKCIKTTSEDAKIENNPLGESAKSHNEQRQDFGFPYFDIEKAYNHFFLECNVGVLKETASAKFQELLAEFKKISFLKNLEENAEKKREADAKKMLEKSLNRGAAKSEDWIMNLYNYYDKGR